MENKITATELRIGNLVIIEEGDIIVVNSINIVPRDFRHIVSCMDGHWYELENLSQSP
jgi:hypothetical protein